MEVINNESLTAAMSYCYGGFNRKVGMIFATQQRADELARELYMAHQANAIPGVMYKRGINTVYFDTGSTIRFVGVGDTRHLRGCLFHMVLHDEAITDGEVLDFLRGCERFPDAVENYSDHEEMEIDDAAIDSFLNEFAQTEEVVEQPTLRIVTETQPAECEEPVFRTQSISTNEYQFVGRNLDIKHGFQ